MILFCNLIGPTRFQVPEVNSLNPPDSFLLLARKSLGMMLVADLKVTVIKGDKVSGLNT